jgi:hypothetical protein
MSDRVRVTTVLARRATPRRLVPLVAVLALVAVAVGGTLASASSSQARTLSLVAVDLPQSMRSVDVGAKGQSAGDTIFFQETLLENGRKAGGSEVLCVTVSRTLGRCHGTLRLRGGTIEASGGTRFGGRFSLPVVGGTGAYAGASGVLTVIAVSTTRSRYVLELA